MADGEISVIEVYVSVKLHDPQSWNCTLKTPRVKWDIIINKSSDINLNPHVPVLSHNYPITPIRTDSTTVDVFITSSWPSPVTSIGPSHTKWSSLSVRFPGLQPYWSLRVPSHRHSLLPLYRPQYCPRNVKTPGLPTTFSNPKMGLS